MRSDIVLRIDPRKIIFFLFIYYLCITNMMAVISAYFEYPVFGFLRPKSGLQAQILLEHMVLALTLFLILSKKINIKKFINSGTGCTFLLFIWMAFVALYSAPEVVKVSYSKYHSITTTIFGKGFVFLLIGLYIHLIDDLFQIAQTRRFFYTVVIIYFSCISLSVVLHPQFSLSSWYDVGIVSGPTGSRLGYQDVGDSTALLLLFIISRTKSSNVKLLVMLMGVYMIVAIGSRSSVLCFAVSAIIAQIIHLFKGNFLKKAFPLVVISLLLYISSLYVPSLNFFRNMSETHRFNPYNIVYDRSYIGRKYWQKVGLREIKKHWLTGRYMSEVVQGRPGTYIHNWLSFWSAFGLGPFLLSILLMIFVMRKSTVLFIHDTNSPIKEFFFMCSIFLIMSVTLARSYTFCYIWLVLSTFPMIHGRVSKESRSIRKRPVYTASQHPMSKNFINSFEVKKGKLTPKD